MKANSRYVKTHKCTTEPAYGAPDNNHKHSVLTYVNAQVRERNVLIQQGLDFKKEIFSDCFHHYVQNISYETTQQQKYKICGDNYLSISQPPAPPK
jgi:hypothetical protein